MERLRLVLVQLWFSWAPYQWNFPFLILCQSHQIWTDVHPAIQRNRCGRWQAVLHQPPFRSFQSVPVPCCTVSDNHLCKAFHTRERLSRYVAIRSLTFPFTNNCSRVVIVRISLPHQLSCRSLLTIRLRISYPPILAGGTGGVRGWITDIVYEALSFFWISSVFIFICSCLFSFVLLESVFVCVFLYFSICGRYQVFTDTLF